MKKNEATETKKVNLRDLDDMACSSVVVTRQIKKLIYKFPSMKEIAIDCWAYGDHYTKFKCSNNKFIWLTNDGKKLSANDEELTKEALNKLIVTTYRTMCDSQNGVDIVDTPEDLLAFAEQKLKEMLAEDNLVQVAV